MPLGPGGLDSNGIWLYGEDDSEALASDLLNLGMQSVSDAISGGLGAILQVLSIAKTDTFSSTNTAFTDITGLSVTVTPSSASNKILLFPNLQTSQDSASTGIALRLARGGSPIFVGDSAGSRTSATFDGSSPTTSGMANSSGSFLDSPNTTGAVTYSVQIRSTVSGNPVYINRAADDADSATRERTVSTLTVMEVAG